MLFFQLSRGQPPSDGSWRDPEFDKVPFSQWFSGGGQTSMRWSEHVLPVILSVHQRLLARVQIQLDGAEAARRRGEGEMIFYFQLTDAKGRIYQDHTTYDLAKVEEGLKAQDISITESAFVLPGEYSIAVAIYDTATGEHAVRKDKLRVAPLRADPLPHAWRDLPPLEFVEPDDPPDHWFLPKERGRLYLPAAPHRPVRIELIANLTPTERNDGRYGTQDRNLSRLFPALKVLSQINGPDVTLNVSLLDLSRRRVTYHQEDAHELDWDRIKSSLAAATSASIDVKSLQDRQHNAAFFVKEVARRVAPDRASADQSVRVAIVLSGPMLFDASQDLHELDVKSYPGSRIFYIRLLTPFDQRQLVIEPRRRRGFGGLSGRTSRNQEEDGISSITQQMDQLEPMLKGLEPKLFDVATAEQSRKAYAAILSEISNM